jgi:hypothetical protein
MTNREVFIQLARPFLPPEKKEKRIKDPKSGKVRIEHYITARSVMNRLDEVLGPGQWWDEYPYITDYSAICRLSIILPDDGRVLTKCDMGGAASNKDPGTVQKSITSDAFKRAAVKFGIGRHLYGDGVANLGQPVQTEQPTEPERKPFKDERSFWKLLCDEVDRKNSAIAADHPDLDDPIRKSDILQLMYFYAWNKAWHTFDPKEDIPDHRKAEVLVSIYQDRDKRNPMRSELKSLLNKAYDEVLEGLVQHGTRGPR